MAWKYTRYLGVFEMNKLMKLVLLVCLGISSVVMANEPEKEGDAAKGKVLSATCAACH
jgi:cytochrome c2